MEAFAEAYREFVNLVGAVNLDSLAGSVENHFAVAAAAQVSLQFGAHLRGYRVVNQIVEDCEKLFTGHFPTPVSLSPFFR
jgi:hypothetical protein